MVCLAVKADAYGHGLVEISRAAAAAGVDYLGIATVDEGIAIRESGIRTPILLLGLATPEEFDPMIEAGIIPFVTDAHLARELASAARRKNRSLPVHLKIDTGMGRIGCSPDEAVGLAAQIAADPVLRLHGVSTHFSLADSADREFTLNQIRLFDSIISELRTREIDPGIVHAANSGGTIDYPESFYHMVRPGIMAYGYYPSKEQERSLALLPVMELVSQLVFVKHVPKGTPISYGATFRAPRDTCIGTVPIGYGDGYFRLLSNRANALVNGRLVPIAGRVCMDQLMLDLGPEPAGRRYDRVVLFGPDPAGPNAETLADLIGTIPYEVTCNVSKRVPRVYIEESDDADREEHSTTVRSSGPISAPTAAPD